MTKGYTQRMVGLPFLQKMLKINVKHDRHRTPELVFDLIQMDGCALRYFKIKNDKGNWQKPNVTN